MVELSENTTREETKQYITDEITNVRKIIDAEMENIRKIQGAETSSLDRNKIYFFDNDGKQIPTSGELGGEDKYGTYNILNKNIPAGTAKIVTVGELVIDYIGNPSELEQRNLTSKPITVIAGGNIGAEFTINTVLFSGGNIKQGIIDSPVNALGNVDADVIISPNKVIAGGDVHSLIEGDVEIISGHNIFTKPSHGLNCSISKNQKTHDIKLLSGNDTYIHINQGGFASEDSQKNKPEEYKKSNMYVDPLNYAKSVKVSAENLYSASLGTDIKLWHCSPQQVSPDELLEEAKKTDVKYQITPSADIQEYKVLRRNRQNAITG